VGEREDGRTGSDRGLVGSQAREAARPVSDITVQCDSPSWSSGNEPRCGGETLNVSDIAPGRPKDIVAER
jgi:hypothetical protein